MLAWLTVALAAVPDTVEKKSGLPQLNVPDMAPQLIWLAITFGVLYFVLSRITVPQISSVIEERQNRDPPDLDEPDRRKVVTDKALASDEPSLAVGPSNAIAHGREAGEKLAAEVEGERSKVEAELAEKLAAAETRISEMKTAAMANVGDIAAETAGDVVKKLIGAEATPDEIRAALQPGAGE